MIIQFLLKDQNRLWHFKQSNAITKCTYFLSKANKATSKNIVKKHFKANAQMHERKLDFIIKYLFGFYNSHGWLSLGLITKRNYVVLN